MSSYVVQRRATWHYKNRLQNKALKNQLKIECIYVERKKKDSISGIDGEILEIIWKSAENWIWKKKIEKQQPRND
jgi:hypothetical protein